MRPAVALDRTSLRGRAIAALLAVLVVAARPSRPAPGRPEARRRPGSRPPAESGPARPSSQCRAFATGSDQPSCSSRKRSGGVRACVVGRDFATAGKDRQTRGLPADLVGTGAERAGHPQHGPVAGLGPGEAALAAAPARRLQGDPAPRLPAADGLDGGPPGGRTRRRVPGASSRGSAAGQQAAGPRPAAGCRAAGAPCRDMR